MTRVTTWTCDGCGATDSGPGLPDGWLVVEVQRVSGKKTLFGPFNDTLLDFHICGIECAWAGKALNEKLAEYDPASVEES